MGWSPSFARFHSTNQIPFQLEVIAVLSHHSGQMSILQRAAWYITEKLKILLFEHESLKKLESISFVKENFQGSGS